MSERSRVESVFGDVQSFIDALKRLREAGLRDLETYSPVGLRGLQSLMPRRGSPVRFITLVAGFAGAALGFWMCIGSALLYSLVVGGKWPASYLPYCIIGFELTILLGGLTALFAMVALARLGPRPPEPEYDPRFQVDKFGITVFCPTDKLPSVDQLLRNAGAQEVHEHRAAEE